MIQSSEKALSCRTECWGSHGIRTQHWILPSYACNRPSSNFLQNMKF